MITDIQVYIKLKKQIKEKKIILCLDKVKDILDKKLPIDKKGCFVMYKTKVKKKK